MSFNKFAKKPVRKPDTGTTAGGGKIEDLNKSTFLSIKGSNKKKRK
jgi:hypothetical protein